MEETETLTAPQEEGVVPESTSKVTPPEAQASEEPQVPAIEKVELDKPEPQVQAAPRARPSDFYGFRKEMRQLKETLSKRDQVIEEMAAYIKGQRSPETAPKKFDKDEFFTDPETVLSAREKAFEEKIEKLNAEIRSMKESNVMSARQKSEQEALEKLFPKTDGSPDSLEERMESQSERVEKLMKLLKTKPVLDMAFKLDPMGSIELILEKLDAEPVKDPKVLPKKLMGGLKGGGGPGSQLTPKEQKMSELRRLQKEEDSNPELRFDEERRAKKEILRKEIEKLLKE